MDMDKTEQSRNSPYCWLWLRITWTKTKKLFRPDKKFATNLYGKNWNAKKSFQILRGSIFSENFTKTLRQPHIV